MDLYLGPFSGYFSSGIFDSMSHSFNKYWQNFSSTFLNCCAIISNFKFIPYFNISQTFVQSVRKTKWTSILSWLMLK